MFRDARSIADGGTLDADLCIVGGGPAGIALALGFRDHAARVVLVESGGLTADSSSQELCEGPATGEPYFSLDACRVRFLGGTTNVWGGWCRPLDALDFEEQPWLRHSGWPFAKADLDAYYRRAQALCRAGDYDYDARPARAAHAPADDRFVDTVFHVAPVRFGYDYRQALASAPGITVLLHGSAVAVEMDDSRRTATRVRIATLARTRCAVTARIFVLAAGGIENPRLMLASAGAGRVALGNGHDLVGRFFADHVHVAAGRLRSPPRDAPFFRVRRAGGAALRGARCLSEDARRREGLPGCAITLHDADDPHDVLGPTAQARGYESLSLLARSLGRGERPPQFVKHVGRVLADMPAVSVLAYKKAIRRPARRLMVGLRFEQEPNAESRVTLDASRDSLGMPRARLHWALTERDRTAFQRLQRVWPDAFGRQAVEVDPAAGIRGAAHHIGTTRMHRDPRRGVVDEHCRVHGAGNVYVAGSSVFPTSGWAPPTLTIVALALRLCDRLKARLAGQVA